MNAWSVAAFLAGALAPHGARRAYQAALAWITRHTPPAAAQAPPPACDNPQPDPADTQHGTDQQLLNQCRQIWRNSPEGEQ